MKKIIALLLSCALALSGCKAADNGGNSTTDLSSNTTTTITITDTTSVISTETTSKADPTEILATSINTTFPEDEIVIPNFDGINDPDFIQYLNDQVYSDLEVSFASDDYVIESIDSIYLSKEYLEELEYNSQSNIFFGYTLNEIEEQFQGNKYFFTIGDDGTTIVKEYPEEEEIDEIYMQAIQKAAIGTGVILLCVTVSVLTGGAGAPVISAIFAASAKTATIMALSCGTISGATCGIVKGMMTHDFGEALKAAAEKGSEGFMWGAIAGAAVGGTTKGLFIARASQVAGEAVANGATGTQLGKVGEKLAEEVFKGRTQVSYLAGKEVDLGTAGATRPDIVIPKLNGAVEAIEVKNYDLVHNLPKLIEKLTEQVGSRVKNLPSGSTQRIALITRGRGYSKAFIDQVVETIQSSLLNTYGGIIPISVL